MEKQGKTMLHTDVYGYKIKTYSNYTSTVHNLLYFQELWATLSAFALPRTRL